MRHSGHLSELDEMAKSAETGHLLLVNPWPYFQDIACQIAILRIPFQKALAFQKTTYTTGNSLR